MYCQFLTMQPQFQNYAKTCESLHSLPKSTPLKPDKIRSVASFTRPRTTGEMDESLILGNILKGGRGEGAINLFVTSKIEFSNPPILQFSNFKCSIKAKEPYKTPF